jgi:aspartate aminotransferase-like enzyme
MAMDRIDDLILLAPGPVHIAPERWNNIAPMHHRTDRFRKVILETRSMLAELLSTRAEIYLLTTSGTGAMDSVIANLTCKGSTLLVVSGGKFGRRWAEIGDTYGCRVDMIESVPGYDIEVDSVLERIARDKPEFLALTHVESSTGAILDINTLLGALPEPRPIVIVDAIASVGSEEIMIDSWGIDVLVGAGQKGLASPPGISFIAIGERGWGKIKKIARPQYYLSLERYAEGIENGDTPFTPATGSIQMLHDSLRTIISTGKEDVLERHRISSNALLEAAGCISLGILPHKPSNSVQALLLPEGMPGEDIIYTLAEKKGIITAGGQGELQGRLLRTGFPGLYSGKTLIRLVRGLGEVMKEYGWDIDLEGALKALEPVKTQKELFRVS